MDDKKLAASLRTYCERFAVPLEYVFDILNDQKVVPMIRGKASEYSAYLAIRAQLPRQEWSVEKLNLNAQVGGDDEDISVTHKRTGIILKVECKNAVRGSMRSGERTRIHKVPHCRIKSHRSRSNIRLAGSSNDRYSVDTFDVIVANLSNALVQPKTVGDSLELLRDRKTVLILKAFYGVKSEDDLFAAAGDDWRFVFPKEIGEKGFVPRTPFLLLENDAHWRGLDELKERLLAVVQLRLQKTAKRRAKSRR